MAMAAGVRMASDRRTQFPELVVSLNYEFLIRRKYAINSLNRDEVSFI
jgi:hypothetical protein